MSVEVLVSVYCSEDSVYVVCVKDVEDLLVVEGSWYVLPWTGPEVCVIGTACG